MTTARPFGTTVILLAGMITSAQESNIVSSQVLNENRILAELLRRFDAVLGKGWVKTRRAGDPASATRSNHFSALRETTAANGISGESKSREARESRAHGSSLENEPLSQRAPLTGSSVGHRPDTATWLLRRRRSPRMVSVGNVLQKRVRTSTPSGLRRVSPAA